jgi:sugar O-acyltransferase (sialic acid O-acetyltransferase NeuD family)
MKKEEIVLIGGGDHCGNCIDTIEQENKFKIAGIVDVPEKIHQKVFGYEIFASDDDLQRLANEYKYFLITIGQIMTAAPRIRVYNSIKKYNVILPVIISPLAYISKYAHIGEGSIIMPFAVIDANVVIGKNCIVQYHTMLAHGAVLEDHCHVSVNSVLGKCRIGSGTFIGVNCWINNGVSIATESVIGSASNVIRTFEQSGVYAGNPAKRIK